MTHQTREAPTDERGLFGDDWKVPAAPYRWCRGTVLTYSNRNPDFDHKVRIYQVRDDAGKVHTVCK